MRYYQPGRWSSVTEEATMGSQQPLRWSQILVAVALLLVSVACQAPAAPAPPAPSPVSARAASEQPAPTTDVSPAARPLDQVRMADARVLASAGIYVALEKGYLREQGIDLQLEPVAGTADIVPFLATGDLDLALGAIGVGLFNAFDRGADMRIIAPAGIMPLEDSVLPLVVRKDLVDSGQVRTPADLRGRRVAVNVRGASVEYVLSKILDRVGMTIHDVDIVSVPFPDMPAALVNGSIDAAIPAEPFATRSVDLGAGVKLVREVIPGQMTTAILASGKLLRERPDVARRLVLAYMKAIRDI